MRVLFLTKYPPSQASSRYCVFQYLNFFEANGLECVSSPFYGEKEFDTIFNKGNLATRVFSFLVCLLRRLKWLFVIRKFDLVVSHREAIPVGPILFERIAKWRGIKYVFIYDDALFLFKKSSKSVIYDWFKSPKKYSTIFALSDLVIGANEHLAETAAKNGANAAALSIGENLERYTQRPQRQSSSKQSICLGWIGSRSTEKYLELIREPLETIGKEFPGTRMVVIGGSKFSLENIEVELASWTLASEVKNLHRMDIGLMPLPLEDWSLGKSGGKARLYMAVGVVPVATSIGFNETLIEHSIDGLLVKSSEDWVMALRQLINNRDSCTTMANEARLTIENKYSIEVTGQNYLSLLQDVVNREK